jgi:putative transposase
VIQRQLKLRLNQAQGRTLEGWLWNLTGLWNWALGQLNHSPWRLSKFELEARVAGHGPRIGVSAEVMKGTVFGAHDAWSRHRRGLAGRPRRKGQRRPLASIPFTSPIRLEGLRARLPILGSLRFHRQNIPAGAVKCGRIVRRASGWYLCLFIDADRAPIARVSSGAVGIDPGFKTLLTLSTGEIIAHPRELEATAARLAQAQRGHRKHLTARLHERMQNQRKDRNHKLSRDLVSRFTEIYFSKDRTSGIAKRFGKSVASSGHSQLRQMLSFKSRAGGTKYVEVDSKLSTKTCSACGALSGPTGLAGLKVRQWTCEACGRHWDRDQNAALNTLIAGAGRAHESEVANAA